jgi:hypothetical protein
LTLATLGNLARVVFTIAPVVRKAGLFCHGSSRALLFFDLHPLTYLRQLGPLSVRFRCSMKRAAVLLPFGFWLELSATFFKRALFRLEF